MKYVYRKRWRRWLAQALDVVGHVFSGFPSGRQDPPDPVRTVLVVRLDHIGDIVRATSIPQLIKEAHPSARLIFLTTSAGSQLLQENPYVDEVIVFDPRWYRSDSGGGSRQPGFRKMIKILKDRRIDVAILPRGDIRENALAKMAAIPHRIGYGITGGSFLLTRVVHYRAQAHEDEHTMDILRAFAIEVNHLRPRIYLNEAMAGARLNTFSKFRMTPDLPWVGIQMEAGTTAKEWAVGRIRSFLDECRTELSTTALYFVGQNQGVSQYIDQLLSAQPGLPWINVIGRTSLSELSVLLSGSRAFVGFDSGPTHMAAALGVPTLFIYSGTNEYEIWKPLAENATVLKNKVDCSPCHLTKCSVEGHPCLEGVSSARVLNWIKERL